MRKYSVMGISSPVSRGRFCNTTSIRSFASDVVSVSASLNSWPVVRTLRHYIAQKYGKDMCRTAW